MAIMLRSEDGGFKYYHFTPTFAGAVAFATLFAIVSGRHAQLLFKKKTWFFIPFFLGCLCKPDLSTLPYLQTRIDVILPS